VITDFILLAVGFVVLLKGADFLVSGASSAAKRLGVSSLVIGLTVVAFGTSAPELIVNIFASVQGRTDIAIGNILGSNTANILLILGVSAAVYPLAVKKGTVWKEIPLSLLAVVLMGIMANDVAIDGLSFSAITRTDGLSLIAFFIIFLYYTFGISRVEAAGSVEEPIAARGLARSVLMIAGGLIALTLGGKWIVDAAVSLAGRFGVSEALIGLTIVAVGTSLPELATSVVAALRKDVDIAVGNVVGSNIFNVFWILGVSALINPLPFSPALMRDVVMTIAATALLFIFMFIGRRHTLERWQGIGFVALYAGYVIYLVMNESARFASVA